ncbi:MAG TPA: hypothetical protein VM243_09335, partial [Phycisphaerae bacterium]|nr:hypothetical protein [Phycisphaerae bacterium]
MAKNFCRDGIAENVQYGALGPRVKSVSGAFQVRNAADGAFVRMAGDDPTADDDFVTKRWGLANLGGGGALPAGLPHANDLIFYVDAADLASYAGTGTTVVDRTGNGSAGTLVGGTAVANGAFQIDGATTKGVSFTKNATLDNLFDGGATVLTFIQTQTPGDGGSGRFLSTEGASTGWYLFGDTAFGGAGVRTRFIRKSGGGTDGTWTGTGAMPRGSAATTGGGFAYTSFGVTYDDSVLANDPTLYNNGLTVGTPAGTNPSALGSDVGNPLKIGNAANDGAPMNGQSQVTLIWSRILTAEEVLQAHN